MKTMPLTTAVAACVLIASIGRAADAPPAGDATRGAAIATTCQGCHGPHGEGVAAAGGPRIAGQTASYLIAQLHAYADGARTNPVMTAIANQPAGPRRFEVDLPASLIGSPVETETREDEIRPKQDIQP